MELAQTIPDAKVRLVADKTCLCVVIHVPVAARDDDLIVSVRRRDGSERKIAVSELELMAFPGGTRIRIIGADSDETGHLFRSMSDNVPMKPDSNRSEATLRVIDKGVSGLSQGFHV
jgi:hypothetical protein